MTTAFSLLLLYVMAGAVLVAANPLRRQISVAIARFRGTELTRALAGEPEPPLWKVVGYAVVVFLGTLALWPIFLIESAWRNRKQPATPTLADSAVVEATQAIIFLSVDALISHLDREWGGDDGDFFAPPLPSDLLPDSEWSVEAMPRFRKDVRSIDKGLRDRVRQALKSVCESPLKPHGDTKRPLEGNLNGLWRYRIGDFRLLYKPNSQERRITILAFSPRGAAYDVSMH